MARRYLGLSPDEWDGLPWWEAILLMEGFETEGLIKLEGQDGGSDPNDLTGAGADLSGFSTRRVG